MSEQSDTDDEIAWMRPYVDGAFDWAGELHVSVQKRESYKIGYSLAFQAKLQKTDKRAVGLVDDFCEQIGVTPNLNINERESTDIYVLAITQREDSETFLEAVFPFLVVRHEQAEILLEDIFPKVAEKEHTTKRGFLDIMYHVDEFKEAGSQRGSGRRKYDLDYFQDEWGMR